MELTKSDIQKLVKVRKLDSFSNHFKCLLKRDFIIFGEVQKNKVKIWQKSIWTGGFYPVYIFEFNDKNQLIKISNRLNSFGKFLLLLFPFTFFSPLIYTGINDFKLTRFLICVSVFLILILACLLLFNKIHQYEKKKQLSEFYKMLGIKLKEEI